MGIKTVLGVSLFSAGAVMAQPAVSSGGVLNAASYVVNGFSNAGIAQGSLFTVFGSGLGDISDITKLSFPLARTLGATSLRVTVGGVSRDAIMVYTTPGQIGAILPSDTPPGSGSLTVAVNGRASAPVAVTVVRSAFGVFTRNQAGNGPAIAQNFNSASDQPLNSLTAPARPGQAVILWGTGLGPVFGNEAGGPLPGDLSLFLEVFVGGKSAQVLYRGRSGCCAGIDQIAFQVPQGVEGCYVPVAVRVGGVTSNFATISVSSGGQTCSDPAGLPSAVLQAQTGLRYGTLTLSRGELFLDAGSQGRLNNVVDTGSAGFFRYSPVQLAGTSSGSFGLPSMGSCMVMTYSGRQTAPPDPLTPAEMDAGAALTVTGTKGAQKMAKADGATGRYSGEFGAGTYLDPGTYTVSGPGGADVGAFTATLNVAQPLVWTNRDAVINISRGQSLPIQWSGGDPAGFVQILGISASASPQIAGIFSCAERVSARQFTVPSYVLDALPASAVQNGVNSGLLFVSASGLPVTFSASGLDLGQALYATLTGKNVNFFNSGTGGLRR